MESVVKNSIKAVQPDLAAFRGEFRGELAAGPIVRKCIRRPGPETSHPRDGPTRHWLSDTPRRGMSAQANA